MRPFTVTFRWSKITQINFHRSIQYISGVYGSFHQICDNANYDRFPPNFDIAWTSIQHVFAPNSKSFRTSKTELYTKEVGEFSIMLYGKMGWRAFFCPLAWLPQYRCIEGIFWTLSSCNSFNCWYINLKRTEILQNGVTYIVLKFCQKVFNLIFYDVIGNLDILLKMIPWYWNLAGKHCRKKGKINFLIASWCIRYEMGVERYLQFCHKVWRILSGRKVMRKNFERDMSIFRQNSGKGMSFRRNFI